MRAFGSSPWTRGLTLTATAISITITTAMRMTTPSPAAAAVQRAQDAADDVPTPARSRLKLTNTVIVYHRVPTLHGVDDQQRRPDDDQSAARSRQQGPTLWRAGGHGRRGHAERRFGDNIGPRLRGLGCVRRRFDDHGFGSRGDDAWRLQRERTRVRDRSLCLYWRKHDLFRWLDHHHRGQRRRGRRAGQRGQHRAQRRDHDPDDGQRVSRLGDKRLGRFVDRDWRQRDDARRR